MKELFIVQNDGKDVDGQITSKAIRIFKEHGMNCTLCKKDENKKIIEHLIPDKIDCAVVIGGDGSLIEVARILDDKIPIMGINMGTVGYLTEVETDGIEEAADQLKEGKYTIEKRMMLSGFFENGDSDVALNDIIVSRKGDVRIIHFDLYVNGTLLNRYEADGIIISTPTGSTAYNLSAGGPVVEPTASLIVVTPICSHALNTSSVVLSDEDEIIIEIGKGKKNVIENVSISFDGADTVNLQTGDKLKVVKSSKITRLIKLKEESFLEILRKKMKGN